MSTPATELWRGAVCWADLSPSRGHEQTGRRPVLVVASRGFLQAVSTLAVVLPVTSKERGWPNHVPLRGEHGLGRPSWAMTEQIRTIARSRVRGVVGGVDDATLAEVDTYLRDFLDL